MQFKVAGKYYTRVNFKTSMTAFSQLLLGKWVASEGSPETPWLFVGSVRLSDLSQKVLLSIKELINKIFI